MTVFVLFTRLQKTASKLTVSLPCFLKHSLIIYIVLAQSKHADSSVNLLEMQSSTQFAKLKSYFLPVFLSLKV